MLVLWYLVAGRGAGGEDDISQGKLGCCWAEEMYWNRSTAKRKAREAVAAVQ